MAETAPDPFHLLVKPAGAACNLRCTYCFYLPAEGLYPGQRLRMEDRVLEETIRQYLPSQPAGEVCLTWQGGEPTLMGLEFYRRAVALARQHRRPGQTVRFALQTNGVLLDEEWCAFLREHRFLVGLSLDGPASMHDPYRVDAGGRPTFQRVMDGLRLLQANQVELNLLVSVHRRNVHHPVELYRFLRDEAGARFLQLIPIVERVGAAAVSDRSVDGPSWGRFLVEIFDEWVRRDVGQVFVQAFDAALACWLGETPALCLFRETCGDALALEHNGDLYSCDHYVQPQHLLGNISRTPMGELVGGEPQRRFGNDKRDSLPRFCRECEVLFACRGECPRNRFRSAPDGEPGLNHLCAGYLAFFRHIDPAMRAMAELLRRGQAPARVMDLLAAQAVPASPVHRAGRNEPCPCGSGRKFKRCHGRG